MGVRVHMCVCGHVACQKTFLYEEEKQLFLSHPLVMFILYIFMCPRESLGSLRQEMEPGDSSAWWGSKADASGKI